MELFTMFKVRPELQAQFMELVAKPLEEAGTAVGYASYAEIGAIIGQCAAGNYGGITPELVNNLKSKVPAASGQSSPAHDLVFATLELISKFSKSYTKGALFSVTEAQDMCAGAKSVLKKSEQVLDDSGSAKIIENSQVRSVGCVALVKKIETKALGLVQKHFKACEKDVAKHMGSATELLANVPQVTQEQEYRDFVKASLARMGQEQGKLKVSIKLLETLNAAPSGESAKVLEQAKHVSDLCMYHVSMYATLSTYRSPDIKSNKKMHANLRSYLTVLHDLPAEVIKPADAILAEVASFVGFKVPPKGKAVRPSTNTGPLQEPRRETEPPQASHAEPPPREEVAEPPPSHAEPPQASHASKKRKVATASSSRAAPPSPSPPVFEAAPTTPATVEAAPPTPETIDDGEEPFFPVATADDDRGAEVDDLAKSLENLMDEEAFRKSSEPELREELHASVEATKAPLPDSVQSPLAVPGPPEASAAAGPSLAKRPAAGRSKAIKAKETRAAKASAKAAAEDASTGRKQARLSFGR